MHFKIEIENLSTFLILSLSKDVEGSADFKSGHFRKEACI